MKKRKRLELLRIRRAAGTVEAEIIEEIAGIDAMLKPELVMLALKANIADAKTMTKRELLDALKGQTK